jgi:hypothetical protein
VRPRLLAAALAAGSAGDRTPAFTVNLFADVAFSVEYERFERDAFGHQSWVGRIIGDPLSTVTLTWKGDVLSGGVQVRDALYRVRSAEGRTVIEQLDPGSFGEERPPLIPRPARLRPRSPASRRDWPRARSWTWPSSGQPAIEALIAQGISESNAAYARSNIQATMRLVGMGELAGFVESATDMSDDLRAFTSHAAVAAARNSVQADLMHLVVANTTGNACGIGWLGPRADFAHGVSARQCFALRVLAQGAGGTSIPSNEASVSVGPACTTPSAPVLTGSRSGNVVTIEWSTPPGGPVTGYTVIAGSAAGASNLFNGGVGLTNTVSAPVASGSYVIRVVANAACGSGEASNEVLVSVP